eukprot:scaffold68646_cov48-Phaeocystis_antarctica.AAC.2
MVVRVALLAWSASAAPGNRSGCLRRAARLPQKPARLLPGPSLKGAAGAGAGHPRLVLRGLSR